VVISTPFSANVGPTQPYLPWDRWSANKHLVHVICTTVQQLAAEADAEVVLDAVDSLLANAISLHSSIAASGVALGDDTATYQAPWRAALNSLKTNHSEDFELLRLLA